MKKISCKKVSFKLVMIDGFVLSVAYPLAYAAINDTGITWCSNATTNNLACPISDFPRQDGDFGRDVTNNDDTDGHAGFSFTKLDSQGKDLPNDATSWDCIRDNMTGMIWENKTGDGGLRDAKWTYTWYKPGSGISSGGKCYQSGRCDTEKYVQDVNAAGLCGFKDWRMPSPIELAGIVDYSIPDPGPTIDPDYFSNMKSVIFWASSPHANSSSYSAWGVNFSYGAVLSYNKSNTNQVRLVRSGQYSLLFEDLNDGTVSQTNTGLMWAKCIEGLSGDSCNTGTANYVSWPKALQAANNSRLAGYDDWRLPNVKELQSLVDYSIYSPAIDSTYFPNTPSVWFLTSSPYAHDSNHVWDVYFGDGGVSSYGDKYDYNVIASKILNAPKASANYLGNFYDNRVRLVRSGQYFLNVTKSGDGSGTVVSNPEGIDCGSNCSTKFQKNSSVTLTATADSGSTFGGWNEDCGGTGTCQVKMDADKTVTATFTKVLVNYNLSISKSGAGTVTSTDGKINCGTGAGCSASYLQDTSVTLNAKPDDGYKFNGWGGDCASAGTATTCNITMNQTHTVTAIFKKKPGLTANLNVNLTGLGTVTSKPAGIRCGNICTAAFALNSQVTLTATNTVTGYTFVGWQSDYECGGPEPTCVLTMDQAKTVQAIFEKTPWRRLTVTNNDRHRGTVTSVPPGITCGTDCTQLYQNGTEVTLTAQAEPHFIFSGWGKACLDEPGLTCRLTMNADQTVSATFNLLPKYPLNVTVIPMSGGKVTSDPIGITCGLGSRDCREKYESGTQVTLSAKAKAGYKFEQWSDACKQAGYSTVCLINITQPTIVTANFKKLSP